MDIPTAHDDTLRLAPTVSAGHLREGSIKACAAGLVSLFASSILWVLKLPLASSSTIFWGKQTIEYLSLNLVTLELNHKCFGVIIVKIVKIRKKKPGS